MRKRHLLALVLLALLLIQLIPTEHSNPVVNPAEEFSDDRSVSELALLRTACFDCHSNETRYPWYAHVQPLSMWITDHVEEGREELNFSIWHTYSMKQQVHKLDECIELVENGEMPLNSFTWAHPEARLTDDERTMLIGWFKQLRSAY